MEWQWEPKMLKKTPQAKEANIMYECTFLKLAIGESYGYYFQ